MKKKIFVIVLLTAFISSALTITGLCMLFNIDVQGAINLGRLLSAMRFIEAQYVQDVDKDKLIGGAISGMVRSLGDPHSVYLEPKLYSQLKADTSGTFGGIGVYMSFKDNAVQILNVIPEGPGDKAGLKAGDSILAVNSQPVNEIEYGEVTVS